MLAVTPHSADHSVHFVPFRSINSGPLFSVHEGGGTWVGVEIGVEGVVDTVRWGQSSPLTLSTNMHNYDSSTRRIDSCSFIDTSKGFGWMLALVECEEGRPPTPQTVEGSHSHHSHHQKPVSTDVQDSGLVHVLFKSYDRAVFINRNNMWVIRIIQKYKIRCCYVLVSSKLSLVYV